MITQTATLADFFAALFPGAEGLIELRALPSGAQGFFARDDLDAVDRFLRDQGKQDLYFGVAYRRTPGSGKLENCGKLYALFCDIDFKSTPEPEARALIEKFPLKPSIVVRSGGGLHVYWVMREALVLEHEAEYALSLLRRLALYLNGDLNSAEPARVLRVPGTMNLKKDYPSPRPVRIEHLDPERRYHASEFDDVLPDEVESDRPGERFILPDEIAEGDPGRNNMLFRFGRSLKCAGLTEGEISDTLQTANAARCRPPLPKRTVQGIVSHVLKQADRPDFEKASDSTDSASQTQRRLIFTPLRELLSEPEEQVQWLLEKRLPAGGLSLIAGRPKSGKSTFARCLTLAVARGEPFLGWATEKGPVFYLGLEEKRSEVRAHFAAMGATEDDNVSVFIEPSPTDGFLQLRDAVQRDHPVLIVVDPLLKLIRVKDANDYALVSQALEPLLSLARDTGAHVLTVHHSPKNTSPGGDAILGSTAIFAAVDTALLLRRTEQYRTLSSIQRYGEDLDESVLTLDPETRTLSAGPSRQEADETQAAEAIRDYLQGLVKAGKEGEPHEAVEEAEIHEAVEGRTGVKRRALRLLVEQQKVTRTGAGRRGDPYRYTVSLFLVPTYIREQENEKPKSTVNGDEQSPDSRSREKEVFELSVRSREREFEEAEEVSL